MARFRGRRADYQYSVELEVLKLAHHHFREDLSIFFQRTTFFLVLDGGLLGYFLAASDEGAPGYPTMMMCFGLAISLVWYVVSESSIKWIDVWRAKVVELDAAVNPIQTFSLGERREETERWFRSFGRLSVFLVRGQFQEFRKLWYLLFRPEALITKSVLLFIIAWIYLLITSPDNPARQILEYSAVPGLLGGLHA